MAIQGSYFYNNRWGEVKRTAARTLAVAMNITPPDEHSPLWQQLAQGRAPETLIPLLAAEQGRILAAFRCRSTWWLNIIGDVCSFMGLAYATQATQLVRILNNAGKELSALARNGKADWKRAFPVLVSRFLNFIADARPTLDAENLSVYWDKPITPNRLMELGKVDKAIALVTAIAQQHPCQQSWVFPENLQRYSAPVLLNQLQTDVELLKTAIYNFTRTTPGFLLTRTGELPRKLKNHLFNPDSSSCRQRLALMIEDLHLHQPPEFVSFDSHAGYSLTAVDSVPDNPVNQFLNPLEPVNTMVNVVVSPLLRSEGETVTKEPIPEPECVSSAMALNSILSRTPEDDNSDSLSSASPVFSGLPGKYPVADDFRDALLAFFREDVDDRVLVFLIQDILGDKEWGDLSGLVNSARSKAQHRLTRQSMEAAFGTSYHRLQTLARQLQRIVKDTAEFTASSPDTDEMAHYFSMLQARQADFVARQAEVFAMGSRISD